MEGFDQDNYIVSVGGSTFAVDGLLAFAAVAVEVASRVQDYIIDETGRGWPELYDQGQFVGILQAALSDSGAVWRMNDLECAVGRLEEVFGTRIRRTGP